MVETTRQSTTTDRILRKAREMFLEAGFVHVTMDDVAYQLGMSKRTLYEHVRSKRELLREAMLQQVRIITTGVTAIAENPDLNPTDKLRQLVLFASETVPRPSRQFLLDMQRSAPELWGEIDRHRSEAVQRSFRRIFEEGQSRGLFRGDLDVELFLLLLSVLVQKVVNPEVLADVPFTAAQAFSGIVDVLTTGILTDEGRRCLQGN